MSNISNNLKTLLALSALLMGGGYYAQAYSAPNGAVVQQSNQRCTGIVTDQTGEPVIGASVMVKETKKGVMTDINGRFMLNDVKPGSTVVITSVGYMPVTTQWDGAELNVTMQEDTQSLNEVVVVGFGSQKKVNLTGAVSTLSAKELSSRPINTVVDALQGTVPGLQIGLTKAGGALNGSKTFNIRGTGTIGSGSSVRPLVLIDGMEGDLETLNPQDVESVSVLKDASASSIYGSRAAGGVILVTTKSGQAGRTTVNYNNSFRFNSPLNMPKMMDSYTWALYMNEASRNSGNGTWFSDDKLAAIKEAQNDPSKPKMFENNGRWEVWDNPAKLPLGNTDWLKEHFGNSFTQEHTVSFSGGSEKLRYYFSANYLNQGGILRHGDDSRQRYATTAKIDAQVAKWLKMVYTMRFSRTDLDMPTYFEFNGGEFYHNVLRYWPIVPVTDPNGYYVPESRVEELMHGGRNKSQRDMTAQQLAFVMTPLQGWNINVEFNYNIENYNSHREWLTTYGYDVNKNPFVATNPTSSVEEYNYKGNYFNPNIYTDYSISLNDVHNFKIMAGFQSEWYRYTNFTASQDGVLAGIASLNSTSTNPKVSGGPATWTTAGFFGRLNYDYKGRYLFEANMRYDGSSRFLRANRWNLFPSFSAGWNIAQEDFWQDLTKYVNTLKLRASWGKLGNQNTDNWYPFYPTIGYSNQAGNWLVGGRKPNIAKEPALVSALLTWEKSRTWEVALDWGAFNNRLTGSFGYYQRKTYDMVGPAPELPDVLGTAVPKVNNLDMTSKGWDLQVSWRDRIRDFYYGVALTLSDNQVVIDKYPNPSKDLGKTYYKGMHLGDIWGYTTVGIAKTEEEMNNHLANADQSALGSNWTVGDIMFADLDGDHKVNNGENTADKPGDLRIIGNSTPRYNFGLNIDAAYKGFDVKVFFQGTLKRDFAIDAGNAPFWGASGISKWQALGLTNHLDYFRADADNPLGQNLDSYYPRVSWSGSRNNYVQTRYLQNAAYCRLKNLTIGYTLPQNVTRNIYVQALRFFVSAENLFTITNFTDAADPELAGIGGYGFGKNYPLSKTFSVGLSVTF